VIDAFKKYFETGGHIQAFSMIPEMYAINRNHGLSSDEAAKMEMATSLTSIKTKIFGARQLMSSTIVASSRPSP
jgi:hypothetical protein